VDHIDTGPGLGGERRVADNGELFVLRGLAALRPVRRAGSDVDAVDDDQLA
jgi:hypothetical protein